MGAQGFFRLPPSGAPRCAGMPCYAVGRVEPQVWEADHATYVRRRTEDAEAEGWVGGTQSTRGARHVDITVRGVDGRGRSCAESDG